MQAGDFDQLVTLRQPQQTTDKFGQHTSYVVVADVAARVKPLRGREFFAAAAMQSPAEIEVEIYYRPDVQGNWRLSWMNRLYEIIGAPMEDGHHTTLQMMCRAAVVPSAPPPPAPSPSPAPAGVFDVAGFDAGNSFSV